MINGSLLFSKIQLIVDDKVSAASIFFLSFIFILSCLAPILPVGDPFQIGAGMRLSPPSIDDWMGTDNLGRPMFARVLSGIKTTFLLSTFAVLIAGLVGGMAGILAAYFGPLTDEILTRIADIFFAFPPLLLGLIIIATFQPGVASVMIAIVLYSIPTIFRVVRASALVIKTQDFLTIAEVLRTSKLKVILAHYGLNILPVLSVQLVYSISLAMLLESALSFLGLGVQPPGASLGSLIRDSLLYLEFAPWLLLFPSITLSLIILSINQLADMADNLVQPKRY